MTGCGSTTYTDPDDYRVEVPGAAVDLLLTSGESFKARVTWMKLQRLRLVLLEEATPHIAFLSLDPTRVYIGFPLSGEPVWNGVRLRRGDFILLDAGGHVHQRADSTNRWGLIALSGKNLAAYGRTLLGRNLTLSRSAQFLRPPSKASSDLLSLHARACRLSVTAPDRMAHREVARSVEQDLILALVNMLGSGRACARDAAAQRHADIITRFQDAVASWPHQQRLSALCADIGVPERTLRFCCTTFLGCSPLQYMRLWRLNKVRSALSKADHETASIARIAKSHGFPEPGRFAGAYRALFGETPSATLFRTSAESA